MFIIGVVSDSHSSNKMLDKAAQALRGCDLVYHLGDHASDASTLAKAILTKIVVLRGNCDFISTFPASDLNDICGVLTLAVHGHRENVKYGLLHLSLKAVECGARLILYGHTHVPSVENDGERVFVNPGALKDGRYCLIEIENGVIRPFLKRLT